MTDQELKKLHRTDLLELLIAQEKENEQLRGKVAQLEAQLTDRTLDLEKAGSIAEAALQVNGVFQTAQDAAAQYLENIRRLSDRQETLCRQLEEESRKAAEQRMAETEDLQPDGDRDQKEVPGTAVLRGRWCPAVLDGCPAAVGRVLRRP